ncbi:DUF1289 domain-containing protein [Pantoea sp. A4]|uniref:DUF1289 domain-containing protein n=1 Tax=Pantoea sp. A4 TaxID=1225184 RepID=UPI0008FAD935|nr:DUF1289 domain-containing protein [Pantoea sp. A4]
MTEQLEFFPIDSPCRGICQSDSRGYCLGCLRSREERFNWRNLNDVQKQDVLRLCRQRRLRAAKKQKSDAANDPPQPTLF